MFLFEQVINYFKFHFEPSVSGICILTRAVVSHVVQVMVLLSVSVIQQLAATIYLLVGLINMCTQYSTVEGES